MTVSGCRILFSEESHKLDKVKTGNMLKMG